MSQDKKEDLGRKISQQMDNLYREADQVEAGGYITDFLEEIKEPNPKIPEPVFREIFLPYFSGDKVPNKNNLVIQEWCGVVGSGSQAVDVVNVSGETLFVVPPLYDTAGINRGTNAKQRSFGSLYVELSDELKLSPSLARRHMVQEVAPRLTEMIQEKAGGGWDDVFSYYGIGGATKKEGGDKVGETKAIAQDSDFTFE